MPRPLRLDHPGAWFHVTARGNDRRAIYVDDADRLKFLDLIGQAGERFGIDCHAYCLMGNHYHLVVQSVEGRLSAAMQLINGAFGRYFNRRRERSGHLFQGRFHASLIERDSYLLEAVRYVELNPCRAGLSAEPEAWPWSSVGSRIGLRDGPKWLCVSQILERFGEGARAPGRYLRFLMEGLSVEHEPFAKEIRCRGILGSEEFARLQAQRAQEEAKRRKVPLRQKYAGRPSLDELVDGVGDREHRRRKAVEAVLSHGYSMTQVALVFRVHYTTVSRWVAAWECDNS